MGSTLFGTNGMGTHSHAFLLCNRTVLTPGATRGVK